MHPWTIGSPAERGLGISVPFQSKQLITFTTCGRRQMTKRHELLGSAVTVQSVAETTRQ